MYRESQAMNLKIDRDANFVGKLWNRLTSCRVRILLYAFFPPLPPLLFPLLSLTCSSAGGHPLCLRCFTMEMWRPKLRWTEQHSSQIKTPRLILVQPGSDRQRDGWFQICCRQTHCLNINMNPRCFATRVTAVKAARGWKKSFLSFTQKNLCSVQKDVCFYQQFFRARIFFFLSMCQSKNMWNSIICKVPWSSVTKESAI